MLFSWKAHKNTGFALAIVMPGIIWAATRYIFMGGSDRILERTRRELVYVPPATVMLGSREPGAAAPPHEFMCAGFWMGRHEVTVAEYAYYLNDSHAVGNPGCPDLVKRDGIWKARRGRARWPVTHISYEDAERFCAWLSEKWECRVRLPTEGEWEHAARGGIHGARFPWGWGEPAGRACFRTDQPCRTERYAPNAFGLYDMAGNVYEWCAGSIGSNAVARGGSWAERDPATLRVFTRAVFRRDYRDRDVGLRILVEAENKAQQACKL